MARDPDIYHVTCTWNGKNEKLRNIPIQDIHIHHHDLFGKTNNCHPMNMRIIRTEIFPGTLTGFSQPSISILIEIDEKNISERDVILLREVSRNLKVELHSQLARPDQFIAAITQISEEIFEKLKFPVFQKSQIKPKEKREYEITFPRMEGCESLTIKLFHKIISIFSISGERNHPKTTFKEILDIIREIKNLAPRGKNTLSMLRIAHERGVPWKKLWGNVYQFGEGSALR